MKESVAGILKNKNLILLGKRKPGGSIGGKWEFPGGKVKKEESHKEALKREYMEELGIEVEVKDYIASTKFFHNEEEFNLYAYELSSSQSSYQLREHTEFKWFTLDEIKRLGSNLAESDRLLINNF